MRKRKTSLILYLSLLVVVSATSCSDRFCSSFANAVKSQCGAENNKCYITLNKVFNFEWDSLYVFDSELYPDEVSKRLGIDCNCKTIPDGQRRIYFTKGGRIVRQYKSRCYEVNFVEKKNEQGDGVVVVDPKTLFLLESRLVNNEKSYFLFKQ
jgi:hypothetical protein